MVRNIAKPLSIVESEYQHALVEQLSPLKDTDTLVELTYTRRDGMLSRSTGTVAYFSGEPGMDTGSVTVKTEDKGPRTVNLHRIARVVVL
ncbi:MAG TPA: hypothetical protein VGP24_01140 [Glaciihabitans sp.]|jgi:hypothetical protein|nr:hypothetical protein [Glaciihabitans sp.]